MATITGITAERMQQYMNENVVSGQINGLGNLILTTRGGAQIDAGSSIPLVPMASDIEAGRVQLADNAEAIAGVSTDRAVTPWNLANLPGYKSLSKVKYSATGTFQKAQYTGLKAIRVICIGGGGAGGGAQAASSGAHSTGGGGGGGGYAERIIYPESMAATETVTVGAGAVGSAVQAAGATGGTSSFGTFCVATGGEGGNTSTNQTLYVSAPGGDGGMGTVGDILASGSGGGMGTGYATIGVGGHGGNSVFGGGAAGTYSAAGANGISGLVGGLFGGGGSGALNNQSATVAKAGGSGGAGVVIVEILI